MIIAQLVARLVLKLKGTESRPVKTVLETVLLQFQVATPQLRCIMLSYDNYKLLHGNISI